MLFRSILYAGIFRNSIALRVSHQLIQLFGSLTVTFFFLAKVDCKKSDRSLVASLKTGSFEKGSNVRAERDRNDGKRQTDHPSAILKLEGEPINLKIISMYRN